MESRTANLVLRLLQRHLPVPWFTTVITKQGQLPGLLPRVPLSLQTPLVNTTSHRFLDSALSRSENPLDSGEVERNQYGLFFKQPRSPFLAFDRAMDAVRVFPSKPLSDAAMDAVRVVPSKPPSVAQRSDKEVPEPVWRFKLGLRLKSGMYMPSEREETGWEVSSVKKKRKKKMNKHKQRKLRRRDRHRS